MVENGSLLRIYSVSFIVPDNSQENTAQDFNENHDNKEYPFESKIMRMINVLDNVVKG